jgi:hypothetical protein
VSVDPQTPEEGGLVNWRDLPARQRWRWWDQRWHEAIALSERYRLALRSGWWEDSVRVEALAAFAAWVALYDTEVSIDPPGKLQLLAQLDWLRTTLHGGEHPFNPPADRRAFEQHLFAIGCRAPDGRELGDPEGDRRLERHRRELQAELAAIESRLLELDDRARNLHAELDRAPAHRRADHAQRDLSELERTIAQLRGRRLELRCQLDETPDAA